MSGVDHDQPSGESSHGTRVRRRRRSRRSHDRPGPDRFEAGAWGRPLAAFGIVGLLVPVHLRGIPPTVGLVLSALALALALGSLAVWGAFPRVVARRWLAWILAAGVAWSVVAAVRAPFAAPAASDLLRILTGAAAFAVGAFVLDTPSSRRLALVVAAVLAGGMAVTDLMGYGARWQEASGTHFDASALSRFGSHETTGTVLSIVLPVLLAFAVGSSTRERVRLLALATSLVVGFAWISVRCRSAWVGGAVAVGVVLALAAWGDRSGGGGRRPESRLARWLSSPFPLMAAILVFVIAGGGLSGALGDRAQKALNLAGPTVLSRLELWRAGAAMATEQPWLGFGLGSYLVRQGEWSHRGLPAWEVLRRGGDLSNVAHNYALQWAADTGWIGVLLLLAGVTSVLVLAWRTRAEAPDDSDRIWGTGVFATVMGASVTSLASPAFHIGFVWCLACLLCGIAAGPGLLRPEGRRGRFGVTAIAIVLVVVGMWVAARRWSSVPGPQRGIWELTVDAPGGIRPGEVVEWRASFRDSRGNVRSTFPGTRWDPPRWVSVGGSGAAQTRETTGTIPVENLEARGIPVRSDLGHAVLRVRIPDALPGGSPRELWVVGRYRDTDGNEYEALSVVTIAPSGPGMGSGRPRPTTVRP